MAEYVGGHSSPTKSQFDWLTQFPITQLFGANGETGIDIGTNYHTPITSLTAGQVLGVGYYDGGGVVSVACDVNGQKAAIYYQHFDTIDAAIIPGAAVKAGQALGLSGGQLRGGSHPSSPRYSNGPHMEVGFNAPYGGIWNPHHYRPNFNPLQTLEKILEGGIVGGALQGAADATAGIVGLEQLLTGLLRGYWFSSRVSGNVGAGVVQISTQPGFMPVAQAIHDAETFRPIEPTNIFGSLIHDAGVVIFRAMVAAVGLLILFAILARVSQRAYNGAAQGINDTAQTVGSVVNVAAKIGALA